MIGNVPGATGTAHELTTREQNLFGEKYSERDAQGPRPVTRQEEGIGLMKAPRWWRRYDRTPVVELGRTNPTRVGSS